MIGQKKGKMDKGICKCTVPAGTFPLVFTPLPSFPIFVDSILFQLYHRK